MSGTWEISVTGSGEQARVRVRLPQEEITVPELRAIVATLSEVLAAAGAAGDPEPQEISR